MLQQKIECKTQSFHLINVDIERLDDILDKEILANPILLKLDVHGYEKKY